MNTLVPVIWLLITLAVGIVYFGTPEPRPWAEQECDGHGGLRREVPGPHGERTAVCKDGCRHVSKPHWRQVQK